MTDKKIVPKGQVYRKSDAFIKLWTRILIAVMIGGVAGAFLVMGYAAVAYGNVPSDELPVWILPAVITLFSIGIGLPLILGAILGGLAIHRFGWIPLLLVIGGVFASGFSSLQHYEFLAVYGVIAIVLGVVSVFFIAIVFTNVPIWLQFPIVGSPRLYLRGKNKKK
ncbi:MAG TPA: hypothetical protein VIM37_03760 [Candidatus Microsaccharimonas sp.]|jgi:MFS family permease